MRGLKGKSGLAPALVALLAPLWAGCSGGGGFPGLTTGALPYQHSSIMSKKGYSEDQTGPNTFRISVHGPLNTPRERLEKIAVTRAAEIGKTGNLGHFKVDSVQQSVHCKKYRDGGQKTPSGGPAQEKIDAYIVLTADVTYTKQPPDTSFIDSRTAFDQYRAELDQMPAEPAMAAPAAAPECS